MRYSVPLLGFFHSNYRHRKWSKSVFWLFASGFQTPATLSPPLSLSSCQDLCPNLYFWRHVPFICSCGTKPRVSTCGWKPQRALFQGRTWKSSARPSGGRQRLRSSSEPTTRCVADVCVTSFGRTAGPSRLCLLKAANPVSAYAKRRASQRETCTFQEETATMSLL